MTSGVLQGTKDCCRSSSATQEAAPWCHMAYKSDGTQLEETSYVMCDITYVDDECVC